MKKWTSAIGIMPCFTLDVSSSGQLLIDVHVTSGDAKQVALGDANRFRALVDTGANCSCVTERLARKLNLTSVGKTETTAALNRGEVRVYQVGVHIPSPLAHPDGSQEMVSRNFSSVKVLEMSSLQESFDLLIGMDIISTGGLHVSNGHFTFCI